MIKIVRAYYPNGSGANELEDIKKLLETGQVVEVDYDGGRGVKAGDSGEFDGQEVWVGRDIVKIEIKK